VQCRKGNLGLDWRHLKTPVGIHSQYLYLACFPYQLSLTCTQRGVPSAEVGRGLPAPPEPCPGLQGLALVVDLTPQEREELALPARGRRGPANSHRKNKEERCGWLADMWLAWAEVSLS
jgi:hypothetical protein